MTTADIRETLLTHPFLEGLKPEHVDKLTELAAEVTFTADQTIFRIGDQSSRFYLLLSGRVALEVPSPVRTFMIQTVGEGEELGWSSMLSHTRKQFQARCLKESRALAFDGERILAACEEDPAFGYALFKQVVATVAERLQATRIQLIDMYKPVGVKPL
jgi:CRP-like cAMP-binding protein